MEIKKIENFNCINPKSEITFKKCGNIVEAVYLSKRNKKGTIQKISKEEYIHIATGEIKQFKHKETRADNLSAVRVSLQKLRDYINTNVTKPKNCRWITLTYAENMTDTKRLYTDFDKFMKRLRYKIGECEYIVAMEPQGRGAWHAHLLLIFNHEAPFIPNSELAKTWQQGFTKTKALDNVDNIGAYLTAYLGDMELTPENATENMDIKTLKIDGKTKRYIKGGRLHLYPTGFNLFRKSKGIKSPEVEIIAEAELQERTQKAVITYERALELTFDNGNTIIIYHRYYNLKRRLQVGVA